MHLLVDSTGLKLCGSSEWLPEKHGTKTRRSWRKLNIAVDTDTGRIAAAAVTTRDVDDASQVGSLLNWTDGPVGIPPPGTALSVMAELARLRAYERA